MTTSQATNQMTNQTTSQMESSSIPTRVRTEASEITNAPKSLQSSQLQSLPLATAISENPKTIEKKELEVEKGYRAKVARNDLQYALNESQQVGLEAHGSSRNFDGNAGSRSVKQGHKIRFDELPSD